MSTSNLVAIILLVIAILDTLGARYILPRMFEQQSIPVEHRKRLFRFVNIGTLVFAVAAIFIYATQAFG